MARHGGYVMIDYDEYRKVAISCAKLAASSPEYIGMEEFKKRLEETSEIICEAYEKVMREVKC